MKLLDSFIDLSNNRRIIAEIDDQPKFTYDVTVAEFNKLINEIDEKSLIHQTALVQLVDGREIRINSKERLVINCDGMRITFKENRHELSNKRN